MKLIITLTGRREVELEDESDLAILIRETLKDGDEVSIGYDLADITEGYRYGVEPREVLDVIDNGSSIGTFEF